MNSYKRVILKLSGEALGENGRLFDQKMITRVGEILARIADKGIQLGIVIGAGNIWRGRQSLEMDAVTADHMGMLGTVINCLCIRDAIERAGKKAVVFSAIDMPRVCEIIFRGLVFGCIITPFCILFIFFFLRFEEFFIIHLCFL